MFIKRKLKPITGDTKTKTKFVIFPRYTNNEIAWLCKVKLFYVYEEFGYDEPFNQWYLVKIEKTK